MSDTALLDAPPAPLFPLPDGDPLVSPDGSGAESLGGDSAPKARRGRPRKDAAPKPSSPGSGAGGSPSKRGRPSKDDDLAAKLAELIKNVGGMVGAAGLPAYIAAGGMSDPAIGPSPLMADGNAIVAGADRLAAALVKVAADNPAIRRVLEGLVKSTTYGELVMAVAAIAVPIAGNHGLIPAAMLGMVPGSAPGVGAV